MATFSSCENEEGDAVNLSTDDAIKFDISIVTRDTHDPEALEKYDDFFVDGVSCVYLSQRADHVPIDFSEDSNNLYKYVYKKNPEANWETGFNFSPVTDALDWGKIIDNGQFAQVYAFAIMFFPRGADNAAYPYYQVGADQSQADNFMEWDLLAGYHRAEKLRERLRFQLKHVLCRLKVNLYIPVLDVEQGNGYEVTEAKAEAIDFRTDYEVVFPEMDSEGIPQATPTNPEGVKTNIKMKKTVDGEPYKLKDLSKFPETEMAEDNVTKYSFDMIFPMQVVYDNMLRFTLTLNGEEKNFVYKNSNSDSGVKFQGGAITNLDLYLNRPDNRILLLKANVLDWNEASSDFIIMPDEDRKNND